MRDSDNHDDHRLSAERHAAAMLGADHHDDWSPDPEWTAHYDHDPDTCPYCRAHRAIAADLKFRRNAQPTT